MMATSPPPPILRRAALALQVGENGRRARRMVKLGLSLPRRFLPLEEKTILFIFGSQRSGTTLLTHIFERDWNSRVFKEKCGPLSTQDPNGVRLDSLDRVAQIFNAERQPFVVAKPLVESQHARTLMTHFPSIRAIWVYRDYRDVIASAMKKFGNDIGIRNLRRALVDNDWRAEEIAAATRSLILQHFRDDMHPHDAAALFWYSRNIQFFQNGLDQPDLSPRTLLLPYERLVQNPEHTLRRLYAFVERPFPGSHLVSKVHASSVGKGQSTDTSRPVSEICQSLQARLDASAKAILGLPSDAAAHGF